MCVSVCARARVRAPGCMCACVHARTAAWTRLAGFPYSERGIKRSQVVDIHLYIYCRTVHDQAETLKLRSSCLSSLSMWKEKGKYWLVFKTPVISPR